MNFKKESRLIFLIVLLPFVYLAYVWGKLSEQVPLQWGFEGQVTRVGSKMELLFCVILLPLIILLIFWFVPKIDPKRKIKKMGNKYQTLRLSLVAFMSLLSLNIIYAASNQINFASPNIILLIGILYIILGNYFKIIRPNYFIGIRTPWTLEKETHKLGGKMWFIGGAILILTGLLLEYRFHQLSFMIFLIVTGIICIVPVLYSYMLFRRGEDEGVEVY
jgi:uncharacterized membrane protein